VGGDSLRRPKPIAFDEVLEFFDDLLRKDSAWSLREEYPLVFGASSQLHLIDQKSKSYLAGEASCELEKDGHVIVFTENGDLKAGLALLKREIKVQDGAPLRLAFIGSVVTDPKYRSQGLQRELFLIAERACREAKVDAMILWSNQVDFYQKLGFQLFGLQASWVPLLLQTDKTFSWSSEPQAASAAFQEGWYESVCKKQMVPNRTKEEMQALFKIPNMALVSEGEAYALIGKGADFENVCHEWAGPADQVLSCFEKIKKQDPSVRFLSPGVIHIPDESRVVQKLESWGYESRLEYLGLIKSLKADLKVEDLQPDNSRHPFFVWGLDSI